MAPPETVALSEAGPAPARPSGSRRSGMRSGKAEAVTAGTKGAGKSADASSRRPSGPRILIAESEPDVQSVLVDLLKIDQVFVARIGETEKARQIVATIVGLAKALGHEVIAEGIETDAQLKELRRLRCTLGQGHFFSPPLEGDSVEEEVLPRFYPDLPQPGRREAGSRRAR